MSELTKQGVRDLNNLGNVDKSEKNGRKDKKWANCFHVFIDYIDDEYMKFRVCEKCGFEDV